MSVQTRVDQLEKRTVTPDDSGPMVALWDKTDAGYQNRETGEVVADLEGRRELCIIMSDDPDHER